MNATAKTLIIGALMVLLVGSLPMLGQEAAAAQAQEQTTITGCLAKGSAAGSYMLTEEKTGNRVTVKGSADLEKHSSNHTVKLTGTKTTEGGATVFNVTKIEHIAPTCKATSPD